MKETMMETTCRFKKRGTVTLASWLRSHRGQVVQIGTKDGAGFLYAGKAGQYTLDAMRSAYNCPFDDLEVLDVYPSAFVGHIVIIPGAFCGKAEIPRELMPKPTQEAPLECYQRFADTIIAEAVKDYKAALICRELGKVTTNTENEIVHAEAFLRSATFSKLSNADGEDIIRLVKQRARKEAAEHGSGRRKKANRIY